MADRDPSRPFEGAAAPASPRLQEAELALAALSRARLPIVVTDQLRPDQPIVLANQAFLDLTGYSRDELIGRNCRFLQGPATDPAAIAAVRRAVAEERELEIELLNYRKDGSSFWNQLLIAPVRDEIGRLTHYFGSQRDVSGRQELQAAKAALDKSEARFRALIEASAQMVWITSPDGRVVEDSPSWRAFTGQSVDECRGHGWLEAIHPEDREAARQAWADALASESTLEREFRICHAPSADWHWAALRATPLRAGDNRLQGWVVMITDIQDHKKAEEEQRKLMKEVDHRAKNALAIVQGIVRLTHASSPEAYAKAVQHRVEALALAHAMLSARRWSAVPIKELMKCELEAHKGARIECDGPALKLPPHIVQPLSLVLHELIDNAQKHGALTQPQGEVRLEWRREPNRRLRLVWRESGGPAADAPGAPGFGMTMVRSIVERQLRGAFDQEWNRDGLRVELVLPLAK